MLTIGCDYHPGFQQIALVDTETGELKERRLAHREDAEQFYGKLKALGGSSSYIFNLLLQETLLIAIIGTAVGIAIAYATKCLLAYALSDFVALETVYEWWPLAGAISAASALLGALFAAWKAGGEDLVQALASKDE